MNNNSEEFANCVAMGTGRTGATWKGCMAYEQMHGPDVSIYENVVNIARANTDGKSNLEVCREHLSRLGRNSIALKLSPIEFSIPEQRLRMFLIASKWLTSQELLKLAALVDRMKAPRNLPLWSVETFMLPPGHPLIAAALRRELDTRYSAKSGAGVAKRSAKTSSNNLASDPLLASQCPWLDVLTDRQRQVFDKLKFTKVADLGQSEGRTPSPNGVEIPCIIPNSRLWVRLTTHTLQGPQESGRLMLGIEKCAVQGIFMDESWEADFDEVFKNDLAGNAFCGPVMLVVVIALLLTVAKKTKAQMDRRADAAREREAQPFDGPSVSAAAAALEPDDEGCDDFSSLLDGIKSKFLEPDIEPCDIYSSLLDGP
jgi:hypothetical protein